MGCSRLSGSLAVAGLTGFNWGRTNLPEGGTRRDMAQKSILQRLLPVVMGDHIHAARQQAAIRCCSDRPFRMTGLRGTAVSWFTRRTHAPSATAFLRLSPSIWTTCRTQRVNGVQMFARTGSKTLGHYWLVVKSLTIRIACHARPLERARDSGSLF